MAKSGKPRDRLNHDPGATSRSREPKSWRDGDGPLAVAVRDFEHVHHLSEHESASKMNQLRKAMFERGLSVDEVNRRGDLLRKFPRHPLCAARSALSFQDPQEEELQSAVSDLHLAFRRVLSLPAVMRAEGRARGLESAYSQLTQELAKLGPFLTVPQIRRPRQQGRAEHGRINNLVYVLARAAKPAKPSPAEIRRVLLEEFQIRMKYTEVKAVLQRLRNRFRRFHHQEEFKYLF